MPIIGIGVDIVKNGRLKKLIKNKKLLENMKKNSFDFTRQNFFDEIKLVDTINRNLKYHA